MVKGKLGGGGAGYNRIVGNESVGNVVVGKQQANITVRSQADLVLPLGAPSVSGGGSDTLKWATPLPADRLLRQGTM